jgi:two-component system nitrate/nitrite response regulator NarL
LSDRCNPEEALALLRAGSDAYLVKTISCDALIQALDLVMLGVTIMPSRVGRILCEARDTDTAAARSIPVDHVPQGLTDREAAILQCLPRGESNKVIARRYDITEATVKVHIKAILRKICVRNRTQAAIWAHYHLSDPPPSQHANGSGRLRDTNGSGPLRHS